MCISAILRNVTLMVALLASLTPFQESRADEPPSIKEYVRDNLASWILGDKDHHSNRSISKWRDSLSISIDGPANIRGHFSRLIEGYTHFLGDIKATVGMVKERSNFRIHAFEDRSAMNSEMVRLANYAEINNRSLKRIAEKSCGCIVRYSSDNRYIESADMLVPLFFDGTENEEKLRGQTSTLCFVEKFFECVGLRGATLPGAIKYFAENDLDPREIMKIFLSSSSILYSDKLKAGDDEVKIRRIVHDQFEDLWGDIHPTLHNIP